MFIPDNHMLYNYPTWIEIKKSSFEHNITQYKRVIGSRNLAVVVKANAYGHGMLQIASLAQKNPLIDWFCVASVSEALELRTNNISKPILVFSIIDVNPIETIGKQIDLTILDYKTATQLNELGKTHNYLFPVHIKIDTGLARFGINFAQAIQFIKAIKQLPNISIRGIYSHFAESQKKDQSFTNQQVLRFKSIVNALQDLQITISYTHLANSAATTTLDLSFCNLFRVGLGIYGLWPSLDTKMITQQIYPDLELIPILEWKSRILTVKHVPTGDTIGYDRSFQAKRDMRIATIPIGYYDGYDFRLANRSYVLIRNQHAPVIGRIAMNITTVDISAITAAQPGDEVILMGPYTGIHPQELASFTGDHNVREIVTKINHRIPRLIVD